MCLGYALVAGRTWKGDMLIPDLDELEIGAHQKFILEESKRKEYGYLTVRRWIHIPGSRWYSKIVRKRLRIPITHPGAGKNRQRVNISVENFKANRESLNLQKQQLTLKPVQTSGRSKVTSSIVITMNEWTHWRCPVEWVEPPGSTLCAERRNIPFSTKIHWCNKVYLVWSGHHARRACLWLLECGRETEACRIRGKVSRNLLYWKKNLPKEKCVRSEIDKSSNDYQTRSCVARSMEKWAKSLRIERNKTGKTRSHNSTVLEDWEEMYFIDPADAEFKDDFLQKKGAEKVGKTPWHQPCRAREWFTLAPRRWKESRKLKSGISWIHKTTTGSSPPTKHEDYIAGKGSRWPITMCRKFIPMPQAMKIPDAKAAVHKEWKKLETIPAWKMEKVKKQEGGYCRSTKRQNRKSSLLNCDGHMPPKKTLRKN